MSMRSVVRAGLAVTERCCGPELVLFVHGLGCSRESFAGAWEAPALSGFSLVAPDLQGHGDTTATLGAPARLEDHAAALGGLLTTYTFERLHVVGHSMGGAVGLILVRDGSLSLASFACVEGNLVAEDCGLVSRHAAETPAEEYVSHHLPRLLIDASQSEDPSMRQWAGWASRCDPRMFHASARSLVEWSDSGQLLEAFNALDARRLYVHGSESPAPPLDLLDARIERVSVPGAGHAVQEDAPEPFYDLLGRFVSGEGHGRCRASLPA